MEDLLTALGAIYWITSFAAIVWCFGKWLSKVGFRSERRIGMEQEPKLIVKTGDLTMSRMVGIDERIYGYLMTGIRRGKDFRLEIDFEMGVGATITCSRKDGLLYRKCYCAEKAVEAAAELRSRMSAFMRCHGGRAEKTRLVVEYKPGNEDSIQFIDGGRCSQAED